MNFLTVVSYVLALVETAALIGSLVFSARSIHENKSKRKTRGKKGNRSTDEYDRNIARYKRNAAFFFLVYLLLNVLRNYSGLLK